jgi:hypothetical protein
MPIYLVERNDNIRYDEFDSMVVIARDELHAIELVKEEDWTTTEPESWDEATVTEVSEEDGFGVVLSSFNAG